MCDIEAEPQYDSTRSIQLPEQVIRKLSKRTANVNDWSNLIEGEKMSHIGDNFANYQKTWDMAVSNRYFSLDANLLIDKLENITLLSKNNEIFKAHVYGALLNIILRSNHIENEYLFKLAYAIQKQLKNTQYRSVENYLRSLIVSLPGCVRSIVTVSSSTGYLIKNVQYGEYIYTVLYSSNHHWRSTPPDLDGASYSPILAWVPKWMDDTGKFYLEFENNTFWIRSGSDLSRYVDTSHNTYVHSPVLRGHSSWTAVNILPSDANSDNCYIQNVKLGNYMYAGADATKENAERRVIFSNGKRSSRDPSYLWNFSPFKLILH